MEVYRRIIEKLPPVGLVSLLGLGEPLLHPSIFEMVRLAGQEDREVSITTNGLPLDERVRAGLFQSELDYLRVSVDQVAPTVARNLQHRFSAKAIEYTQMMVKERGKRKVPHIMFNTVVSNLNADHIPEVIRYARRIGIDAVNLIKLAKDTPYVRRIPPEEEEKKFASYHALGEELGLEVRSNYPARNMRYEYCPFYYNFVYINLYGQVTPCCHMPEQRSAVGDLLQEELVEIWNGKRYRRFWDNASKICGDCTLMVWRSDQIVPPKRKPLLWRLFNR